MIEMTYANMDKGLIVFCNTSKKTQWIADQLSEKGRSVTLLQVGMSGKKGGKLGRSLIQENSRYWCVRMLSSTMSSTPIPALSTMTFQGRKKITFKGVDWTELDREYTSISQKERKSS